MAPNILGCHQYFLYHIQFPISGPCLVLSIVLNFFSMRFRKIKKRLLTSSCLSVRLSAWNNSAVTGRTIMNVVIWVFFLQNLSRQKVSLKITRITGTLHEDQFICMITSRWIILRMRNISDRPCRWIQDSQLMFNRLFSEIVQVYVMMWKNIVKPGRSQMKIWRMRFAC
jgi:hypothetical protein